MGDKNRLIGADALLEQATLGASVTTGALTAGTWYQIIAIGTSTVLPTGLAVGDFFECPTTPLDLTASGGDEVKPATFSTVLEIRSWTLSFSSDEVEVTVLDDNVKKYRKGKADADGSIKGLVIVSESIKAGSILNHFLKIVDAGAATVTVTDVDTSAYYIRGVVQKDTSSGETSCYMMAQVELYGFMLGAELGNAQEYDSKFRVIGNDPIFYYKDHA